MLYNTRAKHHDPGCGKNSPLPPRWRPETEQHCDCCADEVTVRPTVDTVCPSLSCGQFPCMSVRTLYFLNTRGPLQWKTRPRCNIKTVFTGFGISIIKIKESWDRLILIMGIAMLIRWHLYIEMIPGSCFDANFVVSDIGCCRYGNPWYRQWRQIWYHLHDCRWHTKTSSTGSIFRVTGPLYGEFTGHRWIPRTKTSDAELWCFLWSAPEQTVE